MGRLTIAAAAQSFDRDLELSFARIESLLDAARRRGADVVVLPEAALGGYLADLHDPSGGDLGLPPALDLEGPEVERLIALAGSTVVCAGLAEAPGTERAEGARYNTAICVSGGELLGVHRKVHLPLREGGHTLPGDELAAFDTPVGRIGMLICYDKSFPEAARQLALDGADLIAVLSAWPASRTDRAARIEDDRQTRLFDLYDRTRAAENQLLLASANQVGEFGGVDFLGQAKVVSPGGEVLASTGPAAGLAIATSDLETVRRARRTMSLLDDLRPDVYRRGAPAHA